MIVEPGEDGVVHLYARGREHTYSRVLCGTANLGVEWSQMVDDVTCKECLNRAAHVVRVALITAPSARTAERRDCPACHGIGYTGGKRCRWCAGSGIDTGRG